MSVHRFSEPPRVIQRLGPGLNSSGAEVTGDTSSDFAVMQSIAQSDLIITTVCDRVCTLLNHSLRNGSQSPGEAISWPLVILQLLS